MELKKRLTLLDLSESEGGDKYGKEHPEKIEQWGDRQIWRSDWWSIDDGEIW